MGSKGRVFVRGLTSETYGLGQFRQRAAGRPERVRDDSSSSTTRRSATPGTRPSRAPGGGSGRGRGPFLTQTLQVHFVELPPQSSNHGHGHQNEAAFYILEGAGYEIHDDQRYDWKQGDLVFVHTDSVHRHFNPYDEKAVALVDEGQVHVDVHGPDPAGPQRPDRAARRSSATARTGPGSGRRACSTARRSSPRRTACGRRRRWAACG